MELLIHPDGRIEFIHSDSTLDALADEGEVTIRRASHVEPAGSRGTSWTADMEPVGGPVLGPFATRSEALAEEVSWLKANYLV